MFLKRHLVELPVEVALHLTVVHELLRHTNFFRHRLRIVEFIRATLGLWVRYLSASETGDTSSVRVGEPHLLEHGVPHLEQVQVGHVVSQGA